MQVQYGKYVVLPTFVYIINNVFVYMAASIYSNCFSINSFHMSCIRLLSLSNISMSSLPALIVGMLVSILLVVLLLSLVGGIVAVVVRVRRKREMESGQQSPCKAEDKARKEDVRINMYQNVQSQATPASGSSEPNYAIAAGIFVNLASATVSFKTHMYDSAGNLDQESTEVGGGGVYEEARVEWDGGGHYEDPVKSTNARGKQEISATKKMNAKLAKLDDLYAQPSKVKKKKNDAKEDSQVSRKETAAPSDDLYAQPDMAKKKHQKSKQDVEQERKLPLQVLPPYKKHKEAKQEGEDEEDAPVLPPPYVPDKDNGGGDSPMERKLEYTVLDWHN